MFIEVLEGLKHKASFTILKEDINKLAQKKIQDLAKKTNLPGFRAGKAPVAIVKNMYFAEVYQDILTEHINNIFSDEIEAGQIDIANSPNFEIATDGELEITVNASFDVIPNIILGDLSQQNIDVMQVDITDEDVHLMVCDLRQAFHRMQSIETAEAGMTVTVDYVGTINGEEFVGGSATKTKIQLGAGRFLMDFEHGIVGMKLHETKTIPVIFPDDYAAAEFRGKLAQFTITVNEIVEYPDETIDSILCQMINLKGNANLADAVKEGMEHEIQNTMVIRILETLYNCSEINLLPDSLIQEEIADLQRLPTKLTNTLSDLATDKDINTGELSQEEADIVARAKHAVGMRICIRQFIKENNITVSPAEISKEISKIAITNNISIHECYRNESFTAKAEANALEQMVVNTIKKQANCAYKTCTYREFLADKQNRQVANSTTEAMDATVTSLLNLTTS
jgi:trigger factor